jgi:putative membrane protein
MMYWNGDWNGWAWLVMSLSMLVFWALVGVALWFAVRGLSRTQSAPPSTTAEELLRQRYAAGEIDEDEYSRRLHMLRGNALTESR